MQQLPVQPTRLLGRETDLEVVRGLLVHDRARLLTLTGPAGIGKTRLALAVADRVRGAFADGACFVDLVPVRDPDLVVAAIGRALGQLVVSTGAPTATESIERSLRDRQMLLVLDNCEHVLPAAGHIARLLAAAPGLTIVATSREPLRLRWEQRFPVPPLGLPDLRSVPAAGLAGVPSVMLFVERARAVQPDFALTPEHARAVAEICVRLDGLPLAIEVAAAQTSILAPTDILTMLQHHLPLPPWRVADAPARHQTMRAALDWSYELLPPAEQRLLQRLSVFAGGWTLGAADAIAVDGPEPDHGRVAEGAASERYLRLLGQTGSLVERSLVQAIEYPADNETRYHLLEVVRSFALAELQASGQLADVHRRHATYFVQLAETDALQPSWYQRMLREHQNCLAALRWASDQPDSADLAGRLAVALIPFWVLSGYLAEGRQWLELIVAQLSGASLETRWPATVGLGLLAGLQGDCTRSAAMFDQALAQARAQAEADLSARTLGLSAWVAWLTGYSGRSYEFDPLSSEPGQLGDSASGVSLLLALACLHAAADQARDAERWSDQALAMAARLGDAGLEAMARTGRALLASEPALSERAAALVLDGLAQPRSATDRALGTFLRDAIFVAGLLGGTPAQPGTPATPVAVTATPEVIASADQVGAPGLESPLEFSPELSAREHAVLSLIAGGLANKQIAQQLAISERTVKVHVSSVLNKLGADNRARAAVLATRHGLL